MVFRLQGDEKLAGSKLGRGREELGSKCRLCGYRAKVRVRMRRETGD